MNKNEWLFDGYSFLFSRKLFYKLNKAMFYLSLRGIGVLNYKDDVCSGEGWFLLERLRGIAKPVVFDVGGNEGDYSADVLTLNPKTRLFAFEPHPHTFLRASERLAPLGAQMINAACGKTAGKMTLYDHTSTGSEHASLYKGVIEDLHHTEANAYEVQVVDLDTFAMERGIDHIDLLKIDTEGHEIEVLRGATRLLSERRIEAIQFEFNEMNIVSRTFLRDFYSALPEYRLYRMVRDGLVPLPEEPSSVWEIFAFQNIAAVLRPQSSRA
jgi:FkbM family methyltransferase